ncbi:MAG: hypothetical protein JSW10_01540 [Pseudomonadota bacterium]|nr:MAG: hypothetical protein JSW10_01540 [Pseudomonadota bacterium]
MAAGNIGGFIGGKGLNQDDWEPVEAQGEIGVRVDYQGSGWPVVIAVDAFISAAEDDGVLKGTPAVGA